MERAADMVRKSGRRNMSMGGWRWERRVLRVVVSSPVVFEVVVVVRGEDKGLVRRERREET